MSRTVSLPYGKGLLEVKLPENLQPEWIQPPEVTADPDPSRLIRESLDHPIGPVDAKRLKPGGKLGVAVLDGSRPNVNSLLLPALLEWLASYSVEPSQVHLVLASGVHPRPSPEELDMILPEKIVGGCQLHFHDANDKSRLQFLGQTASGTPVQMNEVFMDCDFRVALGVIAPHQFQGYSGGVKAAAIGLAGRETIEHNHAMMVDPDSKLGSYSTNPARQDTEAIGRMVQVDLALNLVLNREDQVVTALSGNPFAVMEAGIPLCQEASCTRVEGEFDLMIASAGGHPRDINLYQAQKALAHACLITRSGGTVILLAACPQGSGSQGFEEAVADHPTPKQVIDRFSKGKFRIGAHKAFQIARDVVDRKVYLRSELEDSEARTYLLEPIATVEQALEASTFDLNKARVGLMPWASKTIPLRADN
ncbi:MAG: nickel-dependent lactate racemase [Anaerolineales bacterium]|jgi:nickel-dependent lactate racemase